jgi:hypothetical protein
LVALGDDQPARLADAGQRIPPVGTRRLVKIHNGVCALVRHTVIAALPMRARLARSGLFHLGEPVVLALTQHS